MLRLHRYFSNGAILQRNAEVKIKGYSTLPVVCSLSGGGYSESVEVQVVNNSFVVTLPPVSDTESVFSLTVKNGEQELKVSLRFGDVYITAGQSNMSYALGSTENAEGGLQRAKKCPISLINLAEPPFTDLSEVVRPAQEQEDFIRDYCWVQGDNFELNNVSAISVQTAVLLSEKKGIPVGIVHTAMGGLGVEAYLNRQTAEKDTEIINFLKDSGRYVSVEDFNNCGGRNYSQLSGVWNEKIAPLKGFSFSGLVWYLGESSAWDFPFAKIFEKCMTLFINDVRRIFGQIPVVTIQIAPEYYPYGDKFGYLYVNEALSALQTVKGVVTVPIYDVEPRWLIPTGELYFHPIHPVNKAQISKRVCDVLTGEREFFPEIASVVREGNKLICKIKNLQKPLKKATFNGFTVAGEDGKYYPAVAKTRGEDEIEVFFEDVLEPCKLTYAFTQYQDFCNVMDEDGAPLLPYRTDREEVGENYCFTPAFFVNGASEVYENCFGSNVGTCRKVSVWKKGEIYNSADVNIQYNQEGLRVSSAPTFSDFGLFGISPAVCLSGHKNQLGNFNFLTFTLKADAKCDFLGVVARASDGEVFRFDLYNGSNKTDAIPLSQNGKRVSVSLSSGMRGDSAPVQFNGENAKTFVQLEFVFRAFNKTEVSLSDITFTKENKSEIFESVKQEALRGDINIQDMS